MNDLFLTNRPYAAPDFSRVRTLLIETYPQTATGFNWDVRRWDGWHFHRRNPGWQPEHAALVHLWESDDSLLGVAHSEYAGDLSLQVRPDARHIEPDMIAWAETHLTRTPDDAPDARAQLETFVFADDHQRQHTLTARGWIQTPFTGVVRRMDFHTSPLPSLEWAPGYSVRGTHADPDDYARAADLLNAAFNRDFHHADEIANMARFAESFRLDLNLLAIAPDGMTAAAMVGVCWEPVNRTGIFEPVCTHPNHRRKGLARSLMVEGLHRLHALGAVDVVVGTGDDAAANALYDSMGFTETRRGVIWRMGG